jgi:hypothetical protein
MTPIAAGVVLALSSAVAFGVTTPIIAWAGGGLGPLTTAALLYAGAAVMAGATRLGARATGGSLRRRDVPRIVGIAIAGAAVAPAFLAWGSRAPELRLVRWCSTWKPCSRCCSRG